MPRRKIISSNLLPAIGDHLCAGRSDRYERGAPGRNILALRAPEFMAVLDVIGGQELFAHDITLHQHFAIVQHGRTAEAPRRIGGGVPTRIHAADFLAPLLPALHIETEKALRPEERDNVLSVSGGSGVAMRGLRVAFQTGNRFELELVPKHLASALLQAEQSPLVRFLFAVAIHITVQANLELGLFARVHRRGYIDTVLPDDRASMT